MYKLTDIVLGADPEIFVENKGGILPAFKFLPSKYDPLKTPEEAQNFYWDGFQAEFNIKASNNILACLRSIKFGLKALLNQARTVDPTAKFSLKTVVETPIAQLKTLNLEFIEFGCMPSYNLYNLAGLRKSGDETPYRFAGGHIHFGIKDLNPDYKSIVQALDATLGVACVSLFEHFDNPIRRQYYGLAGEYRLPEHGLEYRTLSDAWLFHPMLAKEILRFARQVVLNVLNKTYKWDASNDEVIECILRSDVELARRILRRNLYFKTNLTDSYKGNLKLLFPIESQLPMNDIATNWGLSG